jgi:stearoyl-CoA desaturase (delta-9 desaturase)
MTETTFSPDSPPAATIAPAAPSRTSYDYAGAIPFVLCHVAVLGVFWSGVTLESVALGLALLFLRTWGVTAGYHRYFSHRTYKTSRAFQLFLAVLAQSSVQKGALWWAAHHRVHHRESDRPGDVHSPVQRGFWYAHVGWIFADTEETRWSRIRDFARYPELRFLNRWHLLPPVALALGCFAWMGWPGLFVGFFASTVVLWHNTFLVNSLAHVRGTRRFPTSDQSRNNPFIALCTLGEGWHNNHHHFPGSCRNGFYWWEIDVTYYGLRALELLGLVWDLRAPPTAVLEAGRRSDAAARSDRRERAALSALPARGSVALGDPR